MSIYDINPTGYYTRVYDSSGLEQLLQTSVIQGVPLASATDNTIVRWDGGGANAVQVSSVVVDDSNNMSIPAGGGVVFGGTGGVVFPEFGGANNVSLQGPTGITSSYTMILPGVTGATGTLLAIESINGTELTLAWETAILPSVGTSTPDAIVRWDGTDGKQFQDSAIVITDDGSSITGIHIPTGSSVTFNGTGAIIFTEHDGANTLTLRGPASLASDVFITLPTGPGTSGQFLTTDGVGDVYWTSGAGGSAATPYVPETNFIAAEYDATGFNEFINIHFAGNVSDSPSGVNHSATTLSFTNVFNGGIYVPKHQRLYFLPGSQACRVTDWIYMDCSDGTGTAVDYTHGQPTFFVQPTDAFSGGAYSPNQDRIYLCPYFSSTGANWHYIDCETNTVVPYAATSLPVGSYMGAVYAPTADRIYFVPFNRSDTSPWHYIDCTDGSFNSYAVSNLPWASNAWFDGGVFDPKTNRVYFTPGNSFLYYPGLMDEFGYIDVATNSYVDSEIQLPTLGQAVSTIYYECYNGGVYNPQLNRIYWVPYREVTNPQWMYHDLNDPTNAVAYYHGGNYSLPGFLGGCWCPLDNRIYFSGMTGPAGAKGVHYLDCDTNTTGFITINNFQNWVTREAFNSISFAPPLNSMILVPGDNLFAAANSWICSIKNPSYRTLTTTLPRTASESIFGYVAQSSVLFI